MDARAETTDETVVVVDVGARWGAADVWRSLEPDVRVFGFDPDREECERLNRRALEAGDATATYVPLALGPAEGTVTLNVAREPACSSIYPPADHLIETFPALADVEVVETVDVALSPLDSWCRENGVRRVDVMKLDTQGSELGVLQGAVESLTRCLVVECEVEFNPLYEGQPLFGDVDAFLRRHGFVLWRMSNLVHYTNAPEPPRLGLPLRVHSDSVLSKPRFGGGQLYWGDGFWVRADLLVPDADPLMTARAAGIARALGLTDLVMRLRPETIPQLRAEAQRKRRRARRRAAAAAGRKNESAPVPAPSERSLPGRLARRVRSRLRSTD